MKVILGGWAYFECEDCGGEFAAMTTPGAKIYCTNCGKIDTAPEDIQLAGGISFTDIKEKTVSPEIKWLASVEGKAAYLQSLANNGN